MIRILKEINRFLNKNKNGVNRHKLMDFLFEINTFIELRYNRKYALVLLDHGVERGYCIHYTDKKGGSGEIPVSDHIQHEDNGELLGLKSIVAKMIIDMSVDEGKLPMSMFTEKTLKEYLEDRYEPYYLKNDKAHQLEHINSNIRMVKSICYDLDFEYKPYLTMLAAFAHDMYSSEDRTLHHQKAAEHVLKKEDIIYYFLTDDELAEVANACAEHRASYKGEYSSEFTEVFAVADRGDISVRDILTRTYQSSIKRGANFKELDIHSEDQYSVEDVAFIKTFLHVKNKWGKHGYVNTKNIFGKYHKDNIKEVTDYFSNVKPNDLYKKLVSFSLIEE